MQKENFEWSGVDDLEENSITDYFQPEPVFYFTLVKRCIEEDVQTNCMNIKLCDESYSTFMTLWINELKHHKLFTFIFIWLEQRWHRYNFESSRIPTVRKSFSEPLADQTFFLIFSFEKCAEISIFLELIPKMMVHFSVDGAR